MKRRLKRSDTRFRDLAVGDTFDFVDDANPMLNSFFKRCVKTGARTYRASSEEPQDQRLRGSDYRVGSIDVSVFHVRRHA